MNYRVITISILDGSLYDVAEFVNMADADAWAIYHKLTRWDLHSIFVNLSNGQPAVMGQIVG